MNSQWKGLVMKLIKLSAILVIALIILVPALLKAHCQIPCGIYDDQARYDMMKEEITTMEKSMTTITELSSAEGDKNYNQLVRWINNKEDHANNFMEIVTQYFLTQRIKPVEPDNEKYDDYITHLKYFHEMLVYAMKVKQTTDKANIEKLKDLVAKSEALYFK